MKLALFKYAKYPNLGAEIRDASTADMYQVSEWVEVEFPLLQVKDTIAEHIEKLDKAKEEIVNDFTSQLKRIAELKANVLALGYERAVQTGTDDDDDIPF